MISQNKNILNGASTYLSNKNRKILSLILSSFLEAENLPNQPISEYKNTELNKILFGDEKSISINLGLNGRNYKTQRKYSGLIHLIKEFSLTKNSLKEEGYLQEVSENSVCPRCNGSRLESHVQEIIINNFSMNDLTSIQISELQKIIITLKNSLKSKDKIIGDKIFKEIIQKLEFLNEIGLGYLSLNRSSKTLSGGESQRIRLSNQISSRLSGILYVLDEPSIGLHPCDNDKLINAIKNLKKLNNTVIIVEHDEDTIKNADYIVEVGPEAGKKGGEVIFEGSLKDFKKSESSETSGFIYKKSNRYQIKKTSKDINEYLNITRVNENNLKNINVKIPLGKITAITGPSGSGKSTLIHKVLSPALKRNLSNKSNQIIYKKENFQKIEGQEYIDQVIELNQSPLGRSPKSNPPQRT